MVFVKRTKRGEERILIGKTEEASPFLGRLELVHETDCPCVNTAFKTVWTLTAGMLN
jgi:hypothetical protein